MAMEFQEKIAFEIYWPLDKETKENMYWAGLIKNNL